MTTTIQLSDALERVHAAREVLQDHPTILVEWRLEAAVREAERIARADAWRTVEAIVDSLRGAHWAQEVHDADEAESLAEWADLYRGEEVWLGEGGADGFKVSEDGTAITVWAAVALDRDEPDWVTETIPLDDLADWSAPELPGPTEWDLALTGQLSERELIALAQSGDRDSLLAAVCAPHATPAVLHAAGATIDVDVRYREIVIKTPHRWVTAAWIDDGLPAVDLASQIAEVIPCNGVTVTHAVLDTDTGTVTLTVDGAVVRDVGTVDVGGDDDCELFDAATYLLRDHDLLDSGYWPEWVYAGPGFDTRMALLDVTVDV